MSKKLKAKMSMPAAFDGQALLDGLKAAGLKDVENVGKDVVRTVFDWVESSFALKATSEPIWAVAPPILAAIEPAVEQAIDSLG
jgi:hypothetical protein